MKAADRDGRTDVNPGAAGQGIGMVRGVRPAADVFADLVRGAREVLDHGLNAMVRTHAENPPSVPPFSKGGSQNSEPNQVTRGR